MEEGSVPGLRKCVHGGMYVSEEEDLACVSTRRYWRVFVRQLSRYVCQHAYMCVCTCVRVCVCVHGGPGQGLRIRISIPRFQVYLGLLSHPPGPTAA